MQRAFSLGIDANLNTTGYAILDHVGKAIHLGILNTTALNTQRRTESLANGVLYMAQGLINELSTLKETVESKYHHPISWQVAIERNLNMVSRGTWNTHSLVTLAEFNAILAFNASHIFSSPENMAPIPSCVTHTPFLGTISKSNAPIFMNSFYRPHPSSARKILDTFDHIYKCASLPLPPIHSSDTKRITVAKQRSLQFTQSQLTCDWPNSSIAYDLSDAYVLAVYAHTESLQSDGSDNQFNQLAIEISNNPKNSSVRDRLKIKIFSTKSSKFSSLREHLSCPDQWQQFCDKYFPRRTRNIAMNVKKIIYLNQWI